MNRIYNKDSIPFSNLSFEIIIPTYKRNDLLERTLVSLLKEDIPDALLGVWVVENGPQDGADKICQKFNSEKMNIRYVHEPTPGISEARNAGIKAAQADILIFFDNDMRFSGHTLQSYHDAFKKFGLNHYYGGPLYPDYEISPSEWLLPFLPYSAKGWELAPNIEIYDSTDFLGGNHAVPRQHLIKLAGYDKTCAIEDSGGIGAETRLQQKLLANELHGVYVHGAKVWHYIPQDRCTPEWILHRRYRHGLTQGKEMSQHFKNRRKIRNIPLWVWREYISLQSQRLKNILLDKPQYDRFMTLCSLAKQKGIMSALQKKP